jgi:hypothetical protein
MIQNLGKSIILWLSVALLSLIAALIEVVNPGFYSQVVSTELIQGVKTIEQQHIVFVSPV